MTKFSKLFHFSVALLFALLLALPAQAATAPLPAPEDQNIKMLSLDAAHRKRLNIAGRQRLLSQRIISSGCFLAANVDTVLHRKILAETLETYRITLQTLRDGNIPNRLPPETDPTILEAIAAAEDAWAKHADFFQAWLTKSPSTREMRAAQPFAAELLASSKSVVAALKSGEHLTEHEEEAARIVDVAGRQRMFAQRAVKDICLASAAETSGAERLTRHRTVATTIAAFETSSRSLTEGNAMMRVVKTPNQDALWGVEAADAAWDDMRWLLRDSIAGARLDHEDLTLLSQKFEALLPILDDTVWFYVNF